MVKLSTRNPELQQKIIEQLREEFSEVDRSRFIPPRWVGRLDLTLGTQPGLVLGWVTAAITLTRCYRRVRRRGSVPTAKPSSGPTG
jgi:hypothetical protein